MLFSSVVLLQRDFLFDAKLNLKAAALGLELSGFSSHEGSLLKAR